MRPLVYLRKTPLFRRLSRLPITVPLKSKETGYIVYVDLFRNLRFVVRGQWDIDERSFADLLDRFHPRSLWDVGANIGLYSLLFLSRNPIGTVLAFEPDLKNIDLLNRTIRRNALTAMEIVPKAVDRQCGEARFFVDDVTGASGTIISDNLFILDQYGVTNPSQTTVETTTLDDQLRTHNCPDLIKIDVEGADLAVLEGGQRTLEHCLPIIFCEATECNFPRIRILLDNLGYAIFDARTFLPVDSAGAYNIIALHRKKHLTQLGGKFKARQRDV